MSVYERLTDHAMSNHETVVYALMVAGPAIALTALLVTALCMLGALR